MRCGRNAASTPTPIEETADVELPFKNPLGHATVAFEPRRFEPRRQEVPPAGPAGAGAKKRRAFEEMRLWGGFWGGFQKCRQNARKTGPGYCPSFGTLQNVEKNRAQPSYSAGPYFLGSRRTRPKRDHDRGCMAFTWEKSTAGLEIRNGRYNIIVRFGGKRFVRSLKTTDEDEATARRLRVEENIRLVESGRLELPDNADVLTFLLSDGRMASKPVLRKRLSLETLFSEFFEAIPDGNLQKTTLEGMKIHARHLKRLLGVNFAVQTLTLED